DLLIIDDIHVIAGKEGTQQELVRTLSELQLAGARVVLASDAHPREIARLQAALASRFVSGVVAPIGRPDEDMVRRLIPALASRRGLVLDPRGMDLLTSRVLEDELATVRDIEGTLTQVQAMGNLLEKDRALFLSAEHVQRAVEMRAGERGGIRSGPVGINTIIDAVCEQLAVTRADLASSGRAKKVVLAREVIVHLGKRHTGNSYPELAMAIGRPNHSTVITAHNRFRAKLEAGEPIRVGAAIDGCAPGELVGRIERSMDL
ncbi:MAG: DnaA/Hda family protein, partial [Planctomycetota bacterium]